MFRIVHWLTLGCIAGLTLGACGGDDAPGAGGSTATQPAATVTPPIGPTSTAEPGAPVRIRELIQALRDDGGAALEARVRYQRVACTTSVQGIGGPPECAAGEADGTLVDVVFATTCEGFYAREGALQLDQIPFGVFGSGDVLHGVYAIDPASQLARIEPWAGARYAIVLNRIAPSDAALPYVLISDGEAIVGTASGCGESPEEWVAAQGLGEPIFAPE